MKKQLTFEQLSAILAVIGEAHARVREYCATHESDFADYHQRLLVATLFEDQERCQSAIERYQVNADHTDVLNTWIQFVPLQELNASIGRIIEMNPPRFEDLVAAVGDFYRLMGSFIERIKEQAAVDDATKILEDLILLEDQIARSLTKRVAGLRDI